MGHLSAGLMAYRYRKPPSRNIQIIPLWGITELNRDRENVLRTEWFT